MERSKRRRVVVCLSLSLSLTEGEKDDVEVGVGGNSSGPGALPVGDDETGDDNEAGLKNLVATVKGKDPHVGTS